MSKFKKLIILKNEIGLLIIGLLFAIMGGIILIKGAADDIMMPLVFTGTGIVCVVLSGLKIIKEINKPSVEHKQYDKVSTTIPQQPYHTNNEEEEDFIFHFAGKANQSYVMEDQNGNVVYQTTTDKVLTIKDRPFVFKDCITGKEETKMISAPVTISMGINDFFGGMNISSTFKVDGEDIWDVIANLGYGFKFTLNGIAAHYDIHYNHTPIGYCELGGTGLVDPKYKNSPLGKIPTNGIFKVHCRRKDIPAVFLICFAITKTELTVD